MNDQAVQMPIEALCKDWQNLKKSLSDCDNIREEAFREILQNTALCLRPCVAGNAVSKEYIPLIVDAYAFVDAKVETPNITIRAAKVLAERMLYQYVINPDVNEQNANIVTIYVLEAMRQIVVDLDDIPTALFILKEAMQM